VPIFSGSGIRIKIIEGWAAGRAILSTSIGAENLVCQPGRDLLIADDEKEFLNALEALYTDASLRQKLAHHGRLLAETMYNRESQLPRFRRFYEQVAHG
jgi:glycosyltransferase involved in cell wall biosynthesis